MDVLGATLNTGASLNLSEKNVFKIFYVLFFNSRW